MKCPRCGHDVPTQLFDRKTSPMWYCQGCGIYGFFERVLPTASEQELQKGSLDD